MGEKKLVRIIATLPICKVIGFHSVVCISVPQFVVIATRLSIIHYSSITHFDEL
jgi:hypothetical protein